MMLKTRPGAMHRFHSVLMKEAATSDCKLLLVHVPTFFFAESLTLQGVFLVTQKVMNSENSSSEV